MLNGQKCLCGMCKIHPILFFSFFFFFSFFVLSGHIACSFFFLFLSWILPFLKKKPDMIFFFLINWVIAFFFFFSPFVLIGHHFLTRLYE